MAAATETDNADRRDSARSPLFMLVKTSDHRARMWAFDIGLGGMKVRTSLDQMRFPGSYLDLVFCLPGSNETLCVGAQVTSIDQVRGGGLGVDLGIRFCRPSRGFLMTLYRFLDDRRALWDRSVIEAMPSPSACAQEKRPFEGLLLEAFAALRQQQGHSGRTLSVPAWTWAIWAGYSVPTTP